MRYSAPAKILIIAGHDPSGGAGIQADIEAVHALGGFAATLITALTVQNSQGVRQFQTTDPALFQAQADALFDDYPFDAIKIGMIGHCDLVPHIATLLQQHPDIPVIYDPVLASDGGHTLASNTLLPAVRDTLLPLCTLITPNLPEAVALSGQSTLAACGEVLASQTRDGALITGTHDETPGVTNHLFHRDGHQQWHWERLPHRYHGSGCTLASALACLVGQGITVPDATYQAQQFVDHALRHAFQPGQGQHVPRRRTP